MKPAGLISAGGFYFLIHRPHPPAGDDRIRLASRDPISVKTTVQSPRYLSNFLDFIQNLVRSARPDQSKCWVSLVVCPLNSLSTTVTRPIAVEPDAPPDGIDVALSFETFRFWSVFFIPVHNLIQ